jgi:hypothetical protein
VSTAGLLSQSPRLRKLGLTSCALSPEVQKLAGRKKSGGPWTPARLLGAVFWWDSADDGYITTAAGHVTNWRDKLAGLQLVAQTANQNLRNASDANLGGQPSVSIGATGAYFSGVGPVAGPLLSQTGMTVISVQRTTGFAGFGADVLAPFGYSHGFIGPDDATSTGAPSTIVGGSFNFKSTSPTFSNAACVLSSVAGLGVATAMWANGSTVTPSSASTLGNDLTASSTVQVGIRSASPTEGITGTVGDLFVGFNIDTAGRQAVEGYFAWKFGLQASLPANHPYRNAAP